MKAFIRCATLRAAYWDALADHLEQEGRDPKRAAKLRGMAAGACYAVADARLGTRPEELALDLAESFIDIQADWVVAGIEKRQG